jgi:hypothetical protein
MVPITIDSIATDGNSCPTKIRLGDGTYSSNKVTIYN